jgi:hypothetical protein
MNPRPSVEVVRTESVQTRSCLASRRPTVAAALVWACAGLSLILPASAMEAQERPTPPPLAAIAPVISGEYANDTDKNRIDDQLEEKVATSAKLSAAETKSRGLSAQMMGETVSVELIFSEPVTQGQIDTFTALGGTITYVYQAVSYGWIGRIPLDSVSVLPDLMGPSLVLVERTIRAKTYNTDRATQGGRVRPVWKSGFAGNASGFSGDPNTTIGFVDTGVDASHRDMAGRLVYWNDLTSSNSPDPVDEYGHGTATSGIAVGTGEASGVDAGPFTFTYTDPNTDYGYGYWTPPIGLPDGDVTLTTKAWWTGASGRAVHMWWNQGTYRDNFWIIGSYADGLTQSVLTNTFKASSTRNYSVYLANAVYRPLTGAVLVTTVSTYPAVGDGFARFRGVAPGCKYAMVRVPVEATLGEFENAISAGLDLLVMKRITKRIKIISLSMGLVDDVSFLPVQSTSLRNKITSAVNNGIIVVAAAGNEADRYSEEERVMADPPRAALAITVGASNEKNALTEYSTYGFSSPRQDQSEDYKPDLIAPGGSFCYSCLAAPDSGTSDALGKDMEPNDYITAAGTSFSSPFVAGCAAVIVQAMERTGIQWDFTSSQYPRYVKMVLCATASETNTSREGNVWNPTLQRAANGPSGFPSGKDPYEGYGMVNLDAAVEAVSQTYAISSVATETFGTGAGDRRVWARTMELKSGREIFVTLTNPTAGDFDLYLYSSVPSDMGTPVLLASSTNAGNEVTEKLIYSPSADGKALLVVKRVAGSGSFTLNSTMYGPPVARDVRKVAGINAATTVTLDAVDDGTPNPPGSLTYTIASLPQHGRLEQLEGGAPITSVPATLATGVKRVVYRPNADWVGEDSFTYYSNDGGASPFGGRSNTATAFVETVSEISITCRVSASADDVHLLPGTSVQKLTEPAVSIGMSNAGMRFTGVNIPQGARIGRANLKIRSYTTGLFTGFTATIKAEAADNAPSFESQPLNSVTTTTASRSWPLTTGWQSDTWYQSPDIAGVVQEIVNRPGWSSNNALVIIIQGSLSAANERKFWSYDGDPTKAAQLEIAYTPTSAGLPEPPTCSDVRDIADIGSTKTITLNPDDDGLPNPPGKLTCTIASLPQHGQLEPVGGGAVITSVPTTLPIGVKQVVYRPSAGWMGEDSFTYYADDGATPPLGGRSNTATVFVTTVKTVTYQVSASADDMYSGSTPTVVSSELQLYRNYAAMRFTHVDIPPGSHIIRAFLKVCSNQKGLTGINLKNLIVIRAEAADNPPDFSGRLIDASTLTASSQSLDMSDGYKGNTWYQSPNIANVLQEVIDRPGWAADNALVTVCTSDQTATYYFLIYSYDGFPTMASTLEITHW